MAKLDGKCALITGSTSGLGLVIATALAAAGANLVITNVVTSDEGDVVAAMLAREFGVGALYEQADLSAVPQIERLVSAATGRFGGIDIVINNAVVRHFAPIEKLTSAEWDESLAVNLSAPFNIARLTLPIMRRKGWGRIFNLSSYYGVRGADNRIGYVTTKTALIGMTRAIAIEAGNGVADITCNVICPGTLPTPDILGRIDRLAASKGITKEHATQEYLTGRRPNGRFVANESVAELIVFLCGPAGRDITGAVLPVDGGWTAT